jgi:hypothetical protein
VRLGSSSLNPFVNPQFKSPIVNPFVNPQSNRQSSIGNPFVNRQSNRQSSIGNPFVNPQSKSPIVNRQSVNRHSAVANRQSTVAQSIIRGHV